MPASKVVQILAESTALPISLIVLVGGIVFWASSIAAHTDSNTDRIMRLETQQQRLVEMEEQLASVQTKVDLIYDRIRLHEQAGMIVPPRKPIKN